MKTLDKFNTDRFKHYDSMAKLNQPHPNGIKCPECGKELWDSRPMITLTTSPPRKDIHCPKCGYKGYRLA